MPENLIITQCAPTLAGIKVANLFNCEVENKKTLLQQVANLNQRLRDKDIRLMVLSYPKNHALIYLYRPNQLKKDLSDERVKELLSSKGYDVSNMGSCLMELMNRLNENEFPHEIGCFLGYPIEDVLGFINQDKPRKCIGVWQVYGDEIECQKKFAMYKKCTSIYEAQYQKGYSIEDLAVCL